MKEKMVKYTPGPARVFVESKDGMTSVGVDGKALDTAYCCAAAMHEIAEATGMPRAKVAAKVVELLGAIDAVEAMKDA